MRVAAEIALSRGIPVCKAQRGRSPAICPVRCSRSLGRHCVVCSRTIPKSKPQFLAEMRAVWQAGTDEQARVRILSRGIPSPVWAGASTSAESSGFDAVLSGDGDGGDAGANLSDGDRAASRPGGRGRGLERSGKLPSRPVSACSTFPRRISRPQNSTQRSPPPRGTKGVSPLKSVPGLFRVFPAFIATYSQLPAILLTDPVTQLPLPFPLNIRALRSIHSGAPAWIRTMDPRLRRPLL